MVFGFEQETIRATPTTSSCWKLSLRFPHVDRIFRSCPCQAPAVTPLVTCGTCCAPRKQAEVLKHLLACFLGARLLKRGTIRNPGILPGFYPPEKPTISSLKNRFCFHSLQALAFFKLLSYFFMTTWIAFHYSLDASGSGSDRFVLCWFKCQTQNLNAKRSLWS